MITFPPPFAATKFPGYYWHVDEKQLYTIKVNGILRPVQITKPNRKYNMLHEPAYRVSVNGARRYLFLDYLNKLTCEDHEVPVAKKC